jgi:Mrp family chromosome partitioning ATPase
MSAIDQAFIRAYEADDDAPAAASHAPSRMSPPAPHARVTAPAPPTAPAGPVPTAERRPLSSFATGPTVESRFRPALEVDAFRWPAVVEKLTQHYTARWRQAVKVLLSADDEGRSLIGVGGAARGVGCTTVVSCLARLLIEAGKTVAIVDGDFATAGLARYLGLAPEVGWEDVLAGRTPLAECIVQSLEDRIAVLPLVQGGAPAAEKLDAIHASVTAGVLRYHYDIVLFDLGAVTDEIQGPIALRIARRCRLDAVLLTTDAKSAAVVGPARLQQIAPELADSCLGVVENHRAA